MYNVYPLTPHFYIEKLGLTGPGVLLWVVARTASLSVIMKGLDPLRAKKTFIRKKLGHTAVSAIKASSVTL